MNKTKLLIGFLVIAGMSMVLTSGTQLANADIHDGVGSMLGLADCSACQSGGSSCRGLEMNDCYDAPCGLCPVVCPGTSGVVCAYTGSAGSCSDDSTSCGTMKRWSCLGLDDYCLCLAIPWHTEDCGSRNTCS